MVEAAKTTIANDNMSRQGVDRWMPLPATPCFCYRPPCWKYPQQALQEETPPGWKLKYVYPFSGTRPSNKYTVMFVGLKKFQGRWLICFWLATSKRSFSDRTRCMVAILGAQLPPGSGRHIDAQSQSAANRIGAAGAPCPDRAVLHKTNMSCAHKSCLRLWQALNVLVLWFGWH